MSAPPFSIIIPTAGRSTLETTMLRSLVPQLDAGDEVIIVGDGYQPLAEYIANGVRKRNVRYVTGPLTNRFGNAQRDVGLKLAQNDHIWFVDDDDEVMPDIMPFIKRDITEAPDKPHQFIMINCGVPFTSREFVQGQIGIPQFIWPRHPDFPSWDSGPNGLDMETIPKAAALWSEIIYHNRVIYRYVRPKNGRA